MKFSWSYSERVATKRLAEYSSTPREIKISTFRALREEQSRKDFSAKQCEAAAGATKFPPAVFPLHTANEDQGEATQVKERLQTHDEEKTFQSLKSSSSVPLLPLDLSSLEEEVGARTPGGPLKDHQGATSAIGEQTFDATLSQPNSFTRWQTQMRQCIKSQPALLPRKSKSAPTAPTPHGIGKQQTWIKRCRTKNRKLTEQANVFDGKAVILDFPRRMSEMQDGPPKLEKDWLGNLEQPAYRTHHRDSFQREQTRQRESAHPLSVVRLGYGYTDALEPRFQTTYGCHFQHPELRIAH